MASESKRRKGKNSNIAGLGERNDIEKWKCKRIAYFTKRDRLINKRRAKNVVWEVDEFRIDNNGKFIDYKYPLDEE